MRSEVWIECLAILCNVNRTEPIHITNVYKIDYYGNVFDVGLSASLFGHLADWNKFD